MKKLTAPLLIVFLILCLSSCSKDKRFAIDTEPPIEVFACRATLKATGENGSSKKISEKGFCFSSDKIPEYGDNTSLSTNGFVNLFEAEVKGLKAKTKYMVKAYTKFTDGDIIYGDLEEFTTTDVYQIGDIGPALGIIYYSNASATTDKYGEAIINAAISLPWGCSGTEIGSTNLTSSGLANTKRITSNCGSGTAAEYCLNLDVNGFNDWYLPSSGELSLMHSCAQANKSFFTVPSCWSSSEWDATQAYGVNFSGSSNGTKISKNSSLNVIAVRSFN